MLLETVFLLPDIKRYPLCSFLQFVLLHTPAEEPTSVCQFLTASGLLHAFYLLSVLPSIYPYIIYLPPFRLPPSPILPPSLPPSTAHSIHPLYSWFRIVEKEAPSFQKDSRVGIVAELVGCPTGTQYCINCTPAIPGLKRVSSSQGLAW